MTRKFVTITLKFLLLIAFYICTPALSCTCQVSRGQFGDCLQKNPAEVWGNHYDTDIGLHIDCLPPVEENTVRCFRWRLARQCGVNQDQVKCSLKHRFDEILESNNQDQSVTLLSPGFDRQATANPRGAYYNRNFCIFNVSLNCQEEMVEMRPTARTNTLSDAHTCKDYLSFHIHSALRPHYKLCGSEIRDETNYKVIPASSFYAVLWTNDNKMDNGRFEIEAQCKTPSEIPAGSDIPAGSEIPARSESIPPP